MKLLIATRNAGKLTEIRQLLAHLPIDPISAADCDGAPEVDEDADTLEGNAQKKADMLAAYSGLPALADDTGLEVDALDGRPGVHSARFAGEEADDAANRARLLAELDGLYDRRARFRTVVAYHTEGHCHLFEGVCEGRILTEEQGLGGFGYDRLFVADGMDRSFAELSADEKNRISHRGKALRAFVAHISGSE